MESSPKRTKILEPLFGESNLGVFIMGFIFAARLDARHDDDRFQRVSPQ